VDLDDSRARIRVFATVAIQASMAGGIALLRERTKKFMELQVDWRAGHCRLFSVF
jgi:hypothetical protein